MPDTDGEDPIVFTPCARPFFAQMKGAVVVVTAHRFMGAKDQVCVQLVGGGAVDWVNTDALTMHVDPAWDAMRLGAGTYELDADAWLSVLPIRRA